MFEHSLLARRIDRNTDAILALASAITTELSRINRSLRTMSAEFDALTAEVSENSDVIESAVTLIQGLADQIRALADAPSPAAIQALADKLDAQSNALAAAVAANTSAP